MRKRALVIRLSSLGDVVLSTAALPPLAAAGYDVYYVTKPAFAELLESDRRIRGVFRYDKRALGGEHSARAAFLAWARAQNFDLILDLHDSLRSWSWRSALRELAPVTVAHKPRWREWAVLFFRWKSAGLGRGGRAKLFQAAAWRALKAKGEAQPVAADRLPLTSLEIPERSPARVPAGDYVVFAPGSAWAGKRWPEKYFAALGEKLAARAPVVVLGGARESFCAEIALAAARVNPQSVSLHGCTSLSELCAILRGAKAVVGNDTGIVHIAEALGRPVVVIEGPTDASLGFTPYRADSRAVGVDLLCRPCSKSGRFCWRGGSRICLTNVTPAQVESVVREVWK